MVVMLDDTLLEITPHLDAFDGVVCEIHILNLLPFQLEIDKV